MSIRTELRARAENRLGGLIDEMIKAANEIRHPAIDSKDLMRLAIGGRTQALLNKTIGRMADYEESSLLARLEDEE